MRIGGQFHPPYVTDGDALKSGVEAHILAKGLEAGCLLHLVDRVILNDAAVLDPLEHLSRAHTGAWAVVEIFIAGRGLAQRRGLAVADLKKSRLRSDHRMVARNDGNPVFQVASSL